MIKLLKYDEFIYEALDTKFDVDTDAKYIQIKNEHIYLFQINNQKYVAKCINIGSDVYVYKFFHFDSDAKTFTTKKTNIDKNNLPVLSACKQIFLDFTKKHTIKMIFIAAEADSLGRLMLYDRFCDELCQILPNSTKTFANNEHKFLFSVIVGKYTKRFMDGKLKKLMKLTT
jgi:hypothetical protein